MRNEGWSDEVERVAARPYTIELVRESEARFVARVEELPGCVTDGATATEAVEMIEDAKRTWIWSALADGADIPEPRRRGSHSGRFVVRVGTELHRAAVDAARRDGVSLNAWIASAVALRLGDRAAAVSGVAREARGSYRGKG